MTSWKAIPVNNKYDVIVVGAGASGMMAALAALEQGAKVLLLECEDKLGKKILATGNGKCNFTHTAVSDENYHTDDKKKLNAILNKMPLEDILCLFDNLGMLYKEKNGYYYPWTESAVTVLETLENRLTELHCVVKNNSHVTEIENLDMGFRVLVQEKEYYGRTVILAMGSRAGGFYKGPSNQPYKMIENLGLKRSWLFPSLTRCISNESFCKELAGVRAVCTASLYIDTEQVVQETGEIQFTANGLSGIPIFQLSSFVGEAISQKRAVEIRLNLLPSCEKEKFKEILLQMKNRYPDRTVYQVLSGYIHKKLAKRCIAKNGMVEDTRIKDISLESLEQLLAILYQFPFEISNVDKMENAQVCHGGFYLSQFDENMQAISIPGLFMCGELLHVDGQCGGYNLHFAWASGYIAGTGAAKMKE